MLQLWIQLSTVTGVQLDTSIYSKCCDQGYIYLQQMLRSRIQLSTATGVHMDTSLTANASIKDTTIFSNCCVHGLQKMFQLRIQLSAATAMHMDISLTSNATIEDTTIHSNWCAYGNISYSKCFDHGYNYSQRLLHQQKWQDHIC